MSLSRGYVNPLSVLKMRQLSFIPEHFSKITIKDGNIKLLDRWISHNLNSRYAIKPTFIVDKSNRLIEVIEIGIEDPAELTMLTLGCPHLHKI